ncbi:MAG TPA: DNA repair protein RecO [Gemmatimonadaceae bacterium]|nr:DNA repair protein RecO [Gemmatimonadaceae bacterium]
MALLVTEAIVLHAFDYLESSRIVRLVTSDGGMRSALAKGARKSRRRFGSGLDLFAQGTAHLHTRPGRDLDTLSAFEDVITRTALAEDLERFTGAETIAEIVLAFGREGADVELFDAVAHALDTLSIRSGAAAREATLAGVWQIVASLGFTPAMDACAECDSALASDEPALFVHSAGGILCARCAALSSGGRRLPAAARATIAGWMQGASLGSNDPRQPRPRLNAEAVLAESREPRAEAVLDDAVLAAHQRLLREFLGYHLHDGRSLRAFDMWERAGWSAA